MNKIERIKGLLFATPTERVEHFMSLTMDEKAVRDMNHARYLRKELKCLQEQELYIRAKLAQVTKNLEELQKREHVTTVEGFCKKVADASEVLMGKTDGSFVLRVNENHELVMAAVKDGRCQMETARDMTALTESEVTLVADCFNTVLP